MHKLIAAIFGVSCVIATSSSASARLQTAPASPKAEAKAGITDGDRQRLLAHLEMTEGWLVSELDGLSPAQLSFKMSPESWSISEVVEHLSIAEPQYWQQLQASMKQPPADKKPEATDAAILWYGIDRTRRQKTGEARVPHDKSNAQQSLASFRKLRAEMRDYARTTQEDLRARMLIDGNMDVYQWFLMISSHSQRHILQIREIKASAGYPKVRAS
ncbi:MAG: DinB family protein [Acidobacteriota bacterium]